MRRKNYTTRPEIFRIKFTYPKFPAAVNFFRNDIPAIGAATSEMAPRSSLRAPIAFSSSRHRCMNRWGAVTSSRPLHVWMWVMVFGFSQSSRTHPRIKLCMFLGQAWTINNRQALLSAQCKRKVAAPASMLRQPQLIPAKCFQGGDFP